MESDPYALVEAITIMGYACGAEQGYLYIRGEYPLAEARLRGAGAYIVGEETALINSIEGKRAEPRNKPPFPAQSGLFGKPTAINNVETLLSVLEVLRIGGPAFAAIGTEGSTGTRLFCLSGCVERQGLYEHEFGATLGSGVVLVLDDTVDITSLLRRITQFFRDESCGQCVPCRVGTVRQEEVLARMVLGAPFGGMDQELALLDDIGSVTRDASICGRGQTAVSAVQSAIRLGLIGELT
jgi:NADH-quinone oxidoreductase subunit F